MGGEGVWGYGVMSGLVGGGLMKNLISRFKLMFFFVFFLEINRGKRGRL